MRWLSAKPRFGKWSDDDARDCKCRRNDTATFDALFLCRTCVEKTPTLLLTVLLTGSSTSSIAKRTSLLRLPVTWLLGRTLLRPETASA